jgi:hypothetical protein
LANHAECTEARSIAALYLARAYLAAQPSAQAQNQLNGAPIYD